MSEKDIRVFVYEYSGDDSIMRNRKQITAVLLSAMFGIAAGPYFIQAGSRTQTGQGSQNSESTASVTAGTDTYKGFLLDNVLHSDEEGDIHYNLYIPDSYDGSKPYALFLTLPGYQGLYFQGVGSNIMTEDFGFTAQEYNPEMIIVAPQLNDWGETSVQFPVGWSL